MEKYTRAQMEVIEFENEDVITSSSCDTVLHICTTTDYDNPPCSGELWAD